MASVKFRRLRVAGVVAAASILNACGGETATVYTIGTGAFGGNYRVAGYSLAGLVNQHSAPSGLQLTDELSAGSVENLNGIVSGKYQFGIAQSDHLYQALRGEGEWAEAGPQTNLRAVFGVFTESLAVVTGGDSETTELTELKGQRVDIGSVGSGTRQNAIDALTAAGINWETDLEVFDGPPDDRLAMFMHGQLDAFFYTVSHPNDTIKHATYSVRGARLIGLNNVEHLVSENPYYFRTFIPKDLYPRARNDADVETIGIKATFVTSAAVPDDDVYTIAKAIFDHRVTFSERHPVLAGFTAESMLEGITAPLHPGASRLYQELGLEIPQAR